MMLKFVWRTSLFLLVLIFNKYGATHKLCNLTLASKNPIVKECEEANQSCQLQILRSTALLSSDWYFEVTCQANCTPGFDYVYFAPQVLQTNCCSLQECSWEIVNEKLILNGFAAEVPKLDIVSTSTATPTPTQTITHTPIQSATPSSAPDPPNSTRLSNLEEFANKLWSLPTWLLVLIPAVIYGIDFIWLLLLLYAWWYSHKQKKKIISRNLRRQNRDHRNEFELQSRI